MEFDKEIWWITKIMTNQLLSADPYLGEKKKKSCMLND